MSVNPVNPPVISTADQNRFFAVYASPSNPPPKTVTPAEKSENPNKEKYEKGEQRDQNQPKNTGNLGRHVNMLL